MPNLTDGRRSAGRPRRSSAMSCGKEETGPFLLQLHMAATATAREPRAATTAANELYAVTTTASKLYERTTARKCGTFVPVPASILTWICCTVGTKTKRCIPYFLAHPYLVSTREGRCKGAPRPQHSRVGCLLSDADGVTDHSLATVFRD
jgi:hypothetical protein